MELISDMPTRVTSEKLIEAAVAEVQDTASAVNRYLEDEIGSLPAESSLTAQIMEKPRAGYEYKYGGKNGSATFYAGRTIGHLTSGATTRSLIRPYCPASVLRRPAVLLLRRERERGTTRSIGM